MSCYIKLRQKTESEIEGTSTMANILQVTNPGTGTDTRNTLSTQEQQRNIQNDPRIQNPVDPSRVTRADGREGGKTSGAEENSYMIDYESNYGAFIKKLDDAGGLSRLLEKVLSGQTGSAEAEGEASERTGIFAMLTVQTTKELLTYLKEQTGQQVKFSGQLFDGLRELLNQEISENLREVLGDFLKSYNDFSSGVHLLRQMKTLTEDIASLMLRQFRGEMEQLADGMQWDAANGDTAYNTSVLNGRVIPFLSNYISRTHDYGAVRDAVMLLIFHAVRYENGSRSQMEQLLEKLLLNKEFTGLYKGDPTEDLRAALEAQQSNSGKATADVLADMLLKGANGQAGLENIQQYYTMLNGMLLNESVYMPLLHMLFPFQYKEKQVMSEAWVDPDAGRGAEGKRKIKLFLKFDIQGLGKFELTATLQDRSAGIGLAVPKALAEKTADIRQRVEEIMKTHGMAVSELSVRERVRESRIEEIFPEIREKERSINVRI